MALNVGNLVATLELDSKGFSSGIEGAQKKTEGFASGFAAKMRDLAVPLAAVGAAAGAAAVYGVKQFADFEQGMKQVFTLIPDASAEARDKMIADVKAISSEMGILPDKVGAALYDALGAGVPEDNVFAFIKTAQEAAIGGATDLTTTVDGLTSVVNAYGADVLDASTASDIIFQSLKVGKGTFEDLAHSLYNVVPTAQALGVTFGDVGAALAAMTAQGTPTRVATTQMRQMLVEFSKEGSKTATLFKELAGSSFRDFISGGGNVQQALQLLEDHAVKSGIGINDLFGSVEAGSAALTLTGRGTEAFTTALAEMENAAGSTQAAYETMEGGINRQLGKLAADFNVIVLDIGEAIVPVVNDYILPALRGIVDGIKTVMGWFGAAADSPDSLVGTLRGSLAPAVEYFQGKLDDLQAWWDKHSPAFLAAWDALSASIQWAVENIVTPIATALVPVLDFFQKKLAHIFDWYEENAPVFIAAWENIGAVIKWVIDTVIVPLFEWAWPHIEQIYSGVLETMLGVAKLFASILAGDWEEAGEALVDITKGAMQALTGVIAAGWDAIATGIEFVGQGVLGFVYGLWKNIVQWTEDSINRMIDLINGFIQAINSVTEKVGISLPTIGHISLKADKIEIPKLEIPRWSETQLGKNIGTFLESGEDEEEEEDIDKEFEKELEPELTTAPSTEVPEPTSTLVPSTEVPETLIGVPETSIDTPGIPESEPPAISTPTVSVPALDTPVPVAVVNWDQMVAQATVQEPGEQAAAPEIEVPTIEPLPAFSLPLPVTVINWPAALRPVQAAPPATEERVEPVEEEEEDVDQEFTRFAMPAIEWPKFPAFKFSEIHLPNLAALCAPTPSDIMTRGQTPVSIVGGDHHVTVEIDGYAVGEAMFRTWNRRTGGALNG